MKTGFIGAGKVGCSLGRYFVLNGLSVSGFFDVDEESARTAAEFVGTDFVTEL